MSFMEIFQPGLKFLREERERQRMNVAHPTDGADPLMEIDLDAGTATIVVPAPLDSTPRPVAEDQVGAVSKPPDEPHERLEEVRESNPLGVPRQVDGVRRSDSLEK